MMALFLAASAALAGDHRPATGGAGCHVTFGLSHGWGSWHSVERGGAYDGVGRVNELEFDMRFSALGLFQNTAEGIRLQDWFEAGFGFGTERTHGPDGGDLLGFRSRLGLGPALVLLSDGFDAWVRGGVYAGGDSVTGEVLNGFGKQQGWLVGVGATLGPITLDLGVPVGATDRVTSAHLFVAPNGHFGVGLSYDHVVERDRRDRFVENELSLRVGIR